MPVFTSGKEIDELKANLHTTRQQVHQLSQANQQLTEANRHLMLDNQSIFNHRAELQEKIRVSDIGYQEQTGRYQENVQALSRKSEQLQRELELVSDRNAKRTSELKWTVDTLESKLAKSDSVLSQTQRDIVREKEKYAILDSETSTFRTQISGHSKEKEYLQAQVKELGDNLENYQAKNHELEQVVGKLQAELNERKHEQSNQIKYEQDVEDIERNNNTKALRKLKDLIRQKYKLDVEIWRDRKSLRANRPKVLKKMAQADLVLQDIVTAVSLWDNSTGLYSVEEWETAEIIRHRILKEGKKVWANRPPWVNVQGVEDDEPIMIRTRRR